MTIALNQESLRRIDPRILISVAAVLLLAAGCQSPDTGNQAGATTQMYDEHTSGKFLVDEALAQARIGNKKVILLFGANWCPYCRQLHELLANDPVVNPVVEKSFIIVPIDVGTSAHNRNVSLIDRYGATVFSEGVPAVVVVDAEGKRLAPSKDNPWSSKDRIEATRVLSFLSKTGS